MDRFFLLLCFFGTFLLPAYAQVPGLEVREYAKSAPFFISQSPQKLADYLTRNESSEAQKALNIYTWIVHNIRYDVKALKKIKSKDYSLKRILRRRKGICAQYSDLFIALCRNAGLSSREIVGYSRGFSYFEDDSFYEADHAWNGVKIDSSWFLVDATWGSGVLVQKRQWIKELGFRWFKRSYISNKYKFVKAPNFNFFLANPEELIEDHLPVDPYWQLIEYPVSVETFEHKSWTGYKKRIDTLNARVIDSAEYLKVLDIYEFLSNEQYLAKTALNANIFNSRNHHLLSESFFRNALHTPIGKLSPESRIVFNKESINKYRLAISSAKKHQAMAAAEAQQQLRNFQTRSKHELKAPFESRLKSTNLQLSRCKDILLNNEKTMKGHVHQLAILQTIITDKTYTSTIPPGNARQTKPALVEENRRKIDSLQKIVSIQLESVKILQFGIEELLAEKSFLQKELKELNYRLNGNIKKSAAAIWGNLDFTGISQSMLAVVIQGKEIDSLNNKLFSIEDSIRAFHRSIQQLHSSIVSQSEQIQWLYTQNCNLSNGEECDNASYTKYYNTVIRRIYLEKVEGQRMQMNVQRSDFRYQKSMSKLLLAQYKQLKVNGALLILYNEKRIAGIAFKRKKSMYQASRIIKRSNRARQSLTSMNNKLRKKVREEKRKNR